jgi:golgi SNAP receptor complex member 1
MRVRWLSLDSVYQLKEMNDKLAAEIDNSGAPSSSSSHYAVQRHREVLQDYNREYQQTKVNLTQATCANIAKKILQRNMQNALDQASLLGNIRNDIQWVLCFYENCI